MPAEPSRATSLVAARHASEQAMLSAIAGMTRPAAHLLAARAAGSLLAIQPAGTRDAVAITRFVAACLLLAEDQPDPDTLRQAWQALQTHDGLPACLDAASIAMVHRLWPLAPAAESLLTQGGDDRLALDPVSGLNRYGCAPYPRAHVLAFGSCTASSICESGLGAAAAQRRALLAQAAGGSADQAIDSAARSITARLLGHFGIAELAEAMLVASGTDAALLITALIASRHPGEPLTSILMSPFETGSGVPEAVQGRHFASVAASGQRVAKTGALDGIDHIGLQTIALRDAKGQPLPAQAVSRACEAAVAEAAARGHAVLHAIDGSKTGLSAPGWEACRKLKSRYGERLSVVIDACQLRIEPAAIRAYLADGFAVLITGSKFFGAPGFCGAVLAPRGLATRLPAGMRAYASSDGGLIGRRCPGLLLRWTAALHSMARFAAVPPDRISAALARMTAALRTELAAHPRLSLIEAPRPTGSGWSAQQSVFSFTVASHAGPPLSAEALRPLYLALASDSTDAPDALAAIRCQIGQPVSLGTPAVGALRIAFSADQLADDGVAASQIKTIFAKLAWLLDQNRRMGERSANHHAPGDG
jgi:hypothetical protein